MAHDQRIGIMIGSSFGLAFVLANVGGLPNQIAWGLRGLAIVAFVGLIVRLVVRPPKGHAIPSAAGMFGSRYWLVVVGEVLVGVGGLLVINAGLGWSSITVPWIALVVGVHFLALAHVWQVPEIRIVGIAIALCGVAGMVLAAFGVSEPTVRLVSGALSGCVLLVGGWIGTQSAPHTQ